MSSNSAQHWNGNHVCVIDTETTGLEPGYHEIVQICILPLDSKLNVRKDVLPFYINIKPDHPERADPKAMEVNKLDLLNICRTGVDHVAALDMFEEWFNTLGIPWNKYGSAQCKIIPLGHNYGFDKGHIHAWFGEAYYNEKFHYHYRDSMHVALALNDHASFKAETVPFSKVNLSWLCKKLNVVNDKAHDALSDCVATAEVYKKLVQMLGSFI